MLKHLERLINFLLYNSMPKWWEQNPSYANAFITTNTNYLVETIYSLPNDNWFWGHEYYLIKFKTVTKISFSSVDIIY